MLHDVRRLLSRITAAAMSSYYFVILKGNSHQILLSEMSLPGIEELIEKMVPKILGRLGKENPPPP